MPPPYPLHSPGSVRCWSAVPGYLVLRPIPNRSYFGIVFRCLFGSTCLRFGYFVWSCLATKSTQVRPKMLFQGLSASKAWVSWNLIKPIICYDVCPQDRPPHDPRQAQDSSKKTLKAFLFYVEVCVRFSSVVNSILEPLGKPVGLRNRSKIDLKIVQK